MAGPPEDGDFAPPSHPPPILSAAQRERVCQQGYLDLALPFNISHSLNDLLAKASTFFDLPVETKCRLLPSARNDTEHGYSHVPEEKEFITLRYHTSSAGVASASREEERLLTELEGAISESWGGVAQLLHRVLVDISLHLEFISPSAWDPIVVDSLRFPPSKADATPTLMRVFRYLPERGVAEPHRDLGLLTLCVCGQRGLQVWERPTTTPGRHNIGDDANRPHPIAEPDDRWRDAAEVTVLVGDTLRELSGNWIPSGYHRVVATDMGRSSVVFALRPSTRGTIDIAGFGGWGQIESKELWDAIRESRVNINASHEVREGQKARRMNKGNAT